jgi:hypothetical protein
MTLELVGRRSLLASRDADDLALPTRVSDNLTSFAHPDHRIDLFVFETLLH